jgi:polysaccharide biosynthesis transport protein
MDPMKEPKLEIGGAVEVISPRPVAVRPKTVINMAVAEEMASAQIDWRRLLRKHAWLVAALLVLGAAGGFVSVIFATPMYRSRLLLDIQQPRSLERPASNADDTNLQTQMLMIRSGSFLRRVAERIQSETLSVSPVRNDFFTKLRTRLRPEMRNSSQLMSEGVEAAAGSLAVRPVNGTTLLEISCESSHPEVAASFANTVASEFIDQNLQSRALDAQRTNQWLAAQVEETKSSLKEAEDKLQDYVRNSNNLFAAQETTLADTNVRSFQGELASAQADRIAKQSAFEAALRAKPEDALNLIPGEGVRGQQAKLAELKQQRLLLTARLTPQHPKVQQLDLQIRDTEANLRQDVGGALERMRNELESAKRREKMLAGAYAGAASQVTSQAGQAAQYSALRREVEILRQTYSQILMQASQTNISNALPQNNMRVVDAAQPAPEPLRPKPAMNIAFGALVGVMLSGGIVFLRERLDRSLKHPGSARELLNVRELGVIPKIGVDDVPARTLRVRITQRSQALLRRTMSQRKNGESPDLIGWQQKTFLSESYRHTVASLMREEGGEPPKVVLITSPNPSEGKTTICSNLGLALAETGRRVLLIDADFRRPRLHDLFGLKNDGEGLSGLLQKLQDGEEPDLSQLIQPTRYEGLSVLANGPDRSNLPQLLHSGHFSTLISRLRGPYDTILIDAPPVLQIVDARILTQLADGVVLVLRSGSTDRRSAFEAYRALHEDGAHISGTILNDWQPNRKRVDHYYNYVRGEAPLKGRF